MRIVVNSVQKILDICREKNFEVVQELKKYTYDFGDVWTIIVKSLMDMMLFLRVICNGSHKSTNGTQDIEVRFFFSQQYPDYLKTKAHMVSDCARYF